MTCLYGSSPRPGAPNGFWLTLQGVLSFLPSALNGWLAWTPDWLDGAYVSTSQLCAAPQPVVGAFPVADYLACELSPLTQYGASCAVVRSWFNTYVRSLLWANQCQCDAAPGACPSPFAGDAPTNSATWTYWAPPCFAPGCTIPITIDTPTHGGSDGYWAMAYKDASWLAVAKTSGYPVDALWKIHDWGSTFPRTIWTTIPSDWGALYFYAANDIGGVRDVHFSGDFSSCPGAPSYEPAPATPSQPSGIVSIPTGSCATTADLCAELLRLEQYVSELTATANYLARQLAPYSYILGTPSSGLSGTGYIAVTECLGVLVTLTTIPGTKGAQIGTPTRHFDVGRINWGDANGYHAHYPIHESPELIMGIPNTATRIGYTFPAGVVATITPLKRT